MKVQETSNNQRVLSQYFYDGDGGRVKKVVYKNNKFADKKIAQGQARPVLLTAVAMSGPMEVIVSSMSSSCDRNSDCVPTKTEEMTVRLPQAPATPTGEGVEVTRFVGNLYEEAGDRKTKFVYLGGTRVAALTGDDTMYYHTDHLGGTNVLTDKTGMVRELTEYEPFGQIAKHEKYGSDFATAWYYFTGKPVDEETGLMYYGARYYNPKLGKFITPDTIVPNPARPQSLNRYSYCENNPINFTDPTGHKKKSWWKKVWGGVQDFFRDYGGLTGLSGNVFNGIINNDWKPLKNQLIAGASAFVLSGFNPVAAAAAVITTGFLDSKPGRQLTSFVATEIMDDAFGMRPGTAQVWSRVTLQIAGTLAVENGLKSAIADPATASKYDPNNPAHKAITDNPKGYDPSGGRIPGGENIRKSGFKDSQMLALTVKGQSQSTAVVGTARFGSGMVHAGAVSSAFPGVGIQTLPLGLGGSLNPFTGYGSVFGVCHQLSNATLLSSGISTTVWDVSFGWSTVATTMAYGNYGGQLSNYIYTGVKTSVNYDKNA